MWWQDGGQPVGEALRALVMGRRQPLERGLPPLARVARAPVQVPELRGGGMRREAVEEEQEARRRAVAGGKEELRRHARARPAAVPAHGLLAEQALPVQEGGAAGVRVPVVGGRPGHAAIPARGRGLRTCGTPRAAGPADAGATSGT